MGSMKGKQTKMDGDWIAAEFHGRECLYSQA